MWRSIGAGTWIVLALSVLGACGPEELRRLDVFAAASLRDALSEVCAAYQRETGVEPVLNFGSSGMLAVQLERGARADVFFSAGAEELQRLALARRIEDGSRVDLLSNQLVLIVAADAEPLASPEALAGPRIERLAIASPRSVPAGRYARAWLEKAGLWERLEGRILPCLDVRATLAAVEHGGADAGIVYRTDAANRNGVRIVHSVSPEEGPEIVYPAAVVAGSARASEARRFLAYLRGSKSLAVFERHGFRLHGAP